MAEKTAQSLTAYADSVRLNPDHLVGELRDVLGAQLVAYIGSVKETRAVRQWAEGTRTPSDQTISRLRLAYQVAGIVTERDQRRVAQAWFQGQSPALGDISPARMIREGDPQEVGPQIIAAARAFASVG